MKCLHNNYKFFKRFMEKEELEALIDAADYKSFQKYNGDYDDHLTQKLKNYKKFKKRKAFLDNNKFLCYVVIPIFLLSIVLIAIVALCTQKHTENLVKLLTYFLGLITLMATVINYSTQKKVTEEINNKKLVAELIAKSRVEWLKEMRELVSEYMSLANQASFYLEQNWSSIISPEKGSKQKKEFSELIKTCEKYYYLIVFNLNNKEKIYDDIEKYKNIFNETNLKNVLATISSEKYGDAFHEYRTGIQSQVGTNVQAYFKKEWDKAKEEIKSGKVAPPDKQENKSS